MAGFSACERSWFAGIVSALVEGKKYLEQEYTLVPPVAAAFSLYVLYILTL